MPYSAKIQSLSQLYNRSFNIYSKQIVQQMGLLSVIEIIFLTGHTVVMVTFNAKKLILTCAQMFDNLFDVIIVVSTQKQLRC